MQDSASSANERPHMSKIEATAIPTVSTNHMPGPTAISDLMALEVPAAAWMYGGFVLVTQEIVVTEETAWLKPLNDWALKHGFSWVRFDCDGDEVDELPTFESHWN